MSFYQLVSDVYLITSLPVLLSLTVPSPAAPSPSPFPAPPSHPPSPSISFFLSPPSLHPSLSSCLPPSQLGPDDWVIASIDLYLDILNLFLLLLRLLGDR